jgi:hypothetical protein
MGCLGWLVEVSMDAPNKNANKRQSSLPEIEVEVESTKIADSHDKQKGKPRKEETHSAHPKPSHKPQTSKAAPATS